MITIAIGIDSMKSAAGELTIQPQLDPYGQVLISRVVWTRSRCWNDVFCPPVSTSVRPNKSFRCIRWGEDAESAQLTR